MTTCVSEPVSWLRLEQYHLGELAAPARAEIEQHLGSCSACQQCLDAVRAQALLPALPEATRRPWLSRWRAAFAIPSLALAAAVAVFTLRPGDRLKGGDLALTLVREHGGSIELEPTTFAPGDRFKVLVTCAGTLDWDVVVLQGADVSFPLTAGTLECGNRIALPGAFRLGAGEAAICLVPEHADRARIQREGKSALPADVRCTRLLPAPLDGPPEDE